MTSQDDDAPPKERGGDVTTTDSEGSDEVREVRGGARRIGRYELLAKLGEGAVGTVYRAQDPTIRRIVALKLIPARPVERIRDSADATIFGERLFRREVEAAGALQHSGIVTLYDAGRDGEIYYLAMEFVPGETLAAELAREGRLAPERVAVLGAAVAEALDYAHQRGIVHRDIKPSNLMILSDGGVKIADFGIARIAGWGSSPETAGGFIGTPAYMSPEQVGGLALDGRSDIFALGVVLYQALTGRLPFRGDTLPATLHAILNLDPTPPAELVGGTPARLSQVVMRALARDPAARQPRASEMAAELRAALDAPIQVSPEADAVRGASLPRRSAMSRRGFAVAGVGALIAAIAGVAVVLRGRDGRQEPARREDGGGGPPPPRRAPPERAAGMPAAAPETKEGLVALGVMLFKPLGTSPQTSWMPEALRDALNTELSHLTRVKVYSKEFLDFLITRKQLTEIEAATELGIEKILSGSFTESGGELHIETHVVDVRTGVLEVSYLTEGRVEDFAKLRANVVLEAVTRLDLPVTDAERRTLLAQREVEVEPVKRLLESESDLGGDAAPALAPPPGEPRSSLLRWLARVELGGPARAEAQERVVTADPGDAKRAIGDLLERYRKAIESGELDALALAYTSFSPEQRAKQQRYFEGARDLRVAIADADIVVLGDEAVVSFTRTDDFVDTKTGRPFHASVRLTKNARREGGVWKLAAGG